MISVHITDGFKMLVEGLCLSINKSGIANITGTSHLLSECRKALAFKTPNVLILGLNLPDGNCIDFCAEIREKYPDLKIIILTIHNEYYVVNRVLENGADGYILKTAMSEDVIAGIEAVINGEQFFCDEIDALMKKGDDDYIKLTKREQDILKLIVDGYTNKEVSKALFLGLETVKSYRKKIISKTGAKNSMVLVRIAIEKKLI
ncbi:MAG: response regulator transcription factor [Tannerella sp.]|jgi:DNA-binding NarL/FixJ family response regulator|nr:response regulator transcription factor [Tannerella sp.]